MELRVGDGANEEWFTKRWTLTDPWGACRKTPPLGCTGGVRKGPHPDEVRPAQSELRVDENAEYVPWRAPQTLPPACRPSYALSRVCPGMPTRAPSQKRRETMHSFVICARSVDLFPTSNVGVTPLAAACCVLAGHQPRILRELQLLVAMVASTHRLQPCSAHLPPLHPTAG
eukprot:COSAG03_NODE_254_length_9907_cov_43.112765_4_plen_172_part_00